MAKEQGRLFFISMLIVLLPLVYHDIDMIPASYGCPEGTYKFFTEGRAICVDCPSGTFMPLTNHSATSCYLCTEIQDQALEVLHAQCDVVYDTDVRCIQGYYRVHSSGPHHKAHCSKCSGCPDNCIEVRPCQSFSDTVCCADLNGDQMCDNKDDANVVSRCHLGEYLDPDPNECKSCLKDTYMSDDVHRNTKCDPCPKVPDLTKHVIVLSNCTSTRPIQYGCEDGFFGAASLSYKPQEFRCRRCQICPGKMFTGRACDTNHNTICCKDPNMIVVDGPEGGICITSEEIKMHPPVSENIRLEEGDCQSFHCFIAFLNQSPHITWEGQNAKRKIDWTTRQTVKENITITTSIARVCSLTTEDEGKLICRAINVDGNRWEAQVNIGPACKHGTHNPPSCDRNCSHNCKAPTATDGLHLSPCDDINGTCRFGCVDGYTGDLCADSMERVKEENEHHLIVLGVIGFLLSLTVTLGIILGCIAYFKRNPKAGPKWCHKLVHIFAPEPQKAQGAEEQLMIPASKKIQEFEDQIKTLEREKREQKSQIEKIESEKKEQMDTLEHEKKELKNQIDTLEHEKKNQIGELENDKKKQKEEIDRLEWERKKQEEMIKMLQNGKEEQNANLLKEIEGLRNKLKKLQEEDVDRRLESSMMGCKEETMSTQSRPQNKLAAAVGDAYSKQMGVNIGIQKQEDGEDGALRETQEDLYLHGNPENSSEALDKVKEEMQVDLMVIQKMTVYHVENGSGHLKSIFRPFFIYPKYRTELGNYLAEHGCAKSIISILKKMEPFLQKPDECIWSDTNIACLICCKYSSCSQEFAKRMSSLRKASMTTLYFLAKLDGSRHDLRNQRNIEALFHIACMDMKLKRYAMLTLAHIVNKSLETDIQTDKDIVKTFVKSLREETESSQNTQDDFILLYLTKCLTMLAVEDTMKIMIVKKKGLEVFEAMLKRENAEIKAGITDCIQTLAHHPEIARLIADHPSLEQLKEERQRDTPLMLRS